MITATLKFDLYAMTKPKSRQGAILLAREILDQLSFIDELLDAAIARCEAASRPEESAA